MFTNICMYSFITEFWLHPLYSCFFGYPRSQLHHTIPGLQGLTVTVQLHQVIASHTPKGSVFVSLTCAGNSFATSSLSGDILIWKDALYDFQVSHLPTKLLITVYERVGLFKPKVLGELSLILTEAVIEKKERIFNPICNLTALLTWSACHNESLTSFRDTRFTLQPCLDQSFPQTLLSSVNNSLSPSSLISTAACPTHAKEACFSSCSTSCSPSSQLHPPPHATGYSSSDAVGNVCDSKVGGDTCSSLESKSCISGLMPYRIFAGTWNLGNAAPPSLSHGCGMGWLGPAFDCDIVAIGVQESFYKGSENGGTAAAKVGEKDGEWNDLGSGQGGEPVGEVKAPSSLIELAQIIRSSPAISYKNIHVRGKMKR